MNLRTLRNGSLISSSSEVYSNRRYEMQARPIVVRRARALRKEGYTCIFTYSKEFDAYHLEFWKDETEEKPNAT